MPGSTQKCPPQHAPVDIAIIKHPPSPSCVKYFFSNFIPILRTNREMKMQLGLYWYEFKISIGIVNIILKLN